MTPEESAKWDRSTDEERRKFLGMLGDRLAEETSVEGQCHCLFYHANGSFVAKTVHHEPILEGPTGR
jgi:hypothetical protein